MRLTTNYAEILQKLDNIDPYSYGATRNYIDGAVTKLSPYISRGVISVKTIFDTLIRNGINPNEATKFVQQLAWREYFQHVWQEKDVDFNLKSTQENVLDFEISESIVCAQTGIIAIDSAIVDLQNNGYMHNHLRLYVASLACNVAQSYWKMPAKWLYYYLLDADWGSNACSWQWVAGAFSSKKYFANQENINTYTKENQANTFLDFSYEELRLMDIPKSLSKKIKLNLITKFPAFSDIKIGTTKPTLVYNFYNLDPEWYKNEDVNRVLLIEPSHFEKYPICDATMQFMLDLSKNIPNIIVFVAEFKDLEKLAYPQKVIFKEHPAFRHYKGIEETRAWIFPNITGYYASFFKYWQHCEEDLKKYL